MLIGGFLKQSFIDYPKRMAAVIFTQGCNFRCSFCHNPQLVLPNLIAENESLSTKEILAYLESRKEWLDGVVVSGGEPTIHADLPQFLAQIKRLNLAIKLDTNGTNFPMLKSLIDNYLVDFVALDIKTTLEVEAYSKITSVDTKSNIDSIKKCIHLLKSSEIEYEFRTTCIAKIHTTNVLETITSYLGTDEPYTLNAFRDGVTVGSYKKEVKEEKLCLTTQ